MGTTIKACWNACFRVLHNDSCDEHKVSIFQDSHITCVRLFVLSFNSGVAYWWRYQWCKSLDRDYGHTVSTIRTGQRRLGLSRRTDFKCDANRKWSSQKGFQIHINFICHHHHSNQFRKSLHGYAGCFNRSFNDVCGACTAKADWKTIGSWCAHLCWIWL